MSISITGRWPQRKLLLTIFIAFLFVSGYTQESWELEKDENGIQVYTRKADASPVKEVKVTCSLPASVTELAALLMDAPAHEQWVYNTRRSYVVRQINEQRQIYYSETKLPWPLGNRDVVVDLEISQDPVTKVMVVTSVSVDGVVPEKKGIVRVSMSKVRWTVTPSGDGEVSIEYIAQADPAGSLPGWLANAFIAKGPYETFSKLKKVLKDGSYRRTQFALIQD